MAEGASDSNDDEGLPKIESRSVQAQISPLISEDADLQKTLRVKRLPFTRRSIHIADVDEALAKGWSVVKKGKRSATIQKTKAISVSVEDRFWALCRNMGYPVMNGQSLKVTFERDDGSSGSKQIDVFAKDDDTVIVAECKSRETRGRKSLQKDLHETLYLQKPISNAIRKHFGPDFRPKILWLYVTNNIIWSENDIERAASSNIKIITDSQLEYFEAYIGHIGTAGRYQFLAEFFQGQEIPGLEGIKVPATMGRQGKDVFYSFTVEAGLLLKVAFVNHHALNNPEGRPAYQRMVERKRLKDIGAYIRSGGYFPTNILVNFVDRCQFEPLERDESRPDGLKFGHLIFPSKFKSAWIIDGQHRLYGFTNLPDEFLKRPLFVVAFQQMDTVREADLFVKINSNQKSVC